MASRQQHEADEHDPLAHDAREIEKRRQRAAERRDRLLDARTRQFGVDAAALAQQVKDKQAKQLKEDEEKQANDQQVLSTVQALTELELQRQQARAAEAAELRAFHEQQVRDKKSAQERTLAAEPDWSEEKKKTPFLDFAGEDLGKAKREAEQRKQQADWIAQHLSVQQQQEAQLVEQEKAHAAQVKWMTEEKQRLETAAEQARALATRETRDQNMQMAAEKRAREKQRKSADQQADELDISSHLQSELLNEKRGDTAVPYAFKGFDAKKRQDIMETQKQQMAELEARRAKEAAAEAEYAQQQEAVRVALVLQERRRAEAARAARAELQSTVLQQKHEHKKGVEQLNEQLAGKIEPSFFDQFGTSDR